jgi:hypothetical protein
VQRPAPGGLGEQFGGPAGRTVGRDRVSASRSAAARASGPLAGLARHRINTRLIVENWDQICQLTASLRAGTVTASAIMRTLQRGPNPSSLARALAELGRIIKTLHVLQYCRDPEYRRTIRHLLNRGETRTAWPATYSTATVDNSASTTNSARKTSSTPRHHAQHHRAVADRLHPGRPRPPRRQRSPPRPRRRRQTLPTRPPKLHWTT